MSAGKPELGALGKVAAIATAITAILTLVFLLCPDCRPTPNTDKAANVVEAPKPEVQSLAPEGALVIRQFLRAQDTAVARMESALVLPVTLREPSPGASRDEQARYLFALSDHHQAVVRIHGEWIKEVEGLRLVATPVAFNQAVHAYLKALIAKHHWLRQFQIFENDAGVEVRATGSMPSWLLAERKKLDESMSISEASVSQAWVDVKAVALSVGVE